MGRTTAQQTDYVTAGAHRSAHKITKPLSRNLCVGCCSPVRNGCGRSRTVPRESSGWLVWDRRLGASSPPPRTVNLGATTTFTTHPLQHAALIAEASVYVPSTFRLLRKFRTQGRARMDGRMRVCAHAASRAYPPTQKLATAPALVANYRGWGRCHHNGDNAHTRVSASACVRVFFLGV